MGIKIAKDIYELERQNYKIIVIIKLKVILILLEI